MREVQQLIHRRSEAKNVVERGNSIAELNALTQHRLKQTNYRTRIYCNFSKQIVEPKLFLFPEIVQIFRQKN